MLNLLDRSIRPTVAVAIAAIALLEETLILAFQFAVELNPKNARLAVVEMAAH